MIAAAVVALLLLMQRAVACPNRCECSGTVVDCSSLGLTEVPTGIPSATTNLHLSRNQIGALDSERFRNLSALVELDLSHNNLTTLDDLENIDLAKLEVLMLNNNQLYLLVEELFYLSFNVHSLRRLSLAHNYLSGELARDTFGYFLNLEHLDLAYNPITKIDRSGFYHSLQTLNLSHTSVNKISSKGFGYLPNLRSLDLRATQLSTLNKSYFFSLSGLTELKLGGSKLTSLPSYLLNGLKSLTSLEITGTGITTLPSRFLNPCPKLQWLDLSGNALDSVSSFLQSNSAPVLKTLILDDNRLSVVVNAPANVVSVSMKSNQVSQLPATLPPKLEFLDLSDNSIANIIGPVHSDTLRSLNLSANPVTSVASDALVNLTALETLVLSPGTRREDFTLDAPSLILVLTGQGVTCDCNGAERYRNLSFSGVKSIKLICADGATVDDIQNYLAKHCLTTTIPSNPNATTIAIITAVVLIVVCLLIIAGVLCIRVGGVQKIKALMPRLGDRTDSPTRCPTISAEVNVYCEPTTLPRRAASAVENEYGTIDTLPRGYVMAANVVSGTKSTVVDGCNDYALAKDPGNPSCSSTLDVAEKSSNCYENAKDYEVPTSPVKPDSLDLKTEHFYHVPISPSNHYVLPETVPYVAPPSESQPDSNPYLTPISSSSPPRCEEDGGYIDFGNAQDAKAYEVLL